MIGELQSLCDPSEIFRMNAFVVSFTHTHSCEGIVVNPNIG